MKRLIKAESAGFCAGVDRSVALAENALRAGETLWCLGELIHNRDEVARLESAGMRTAQSVEEIPAGAVVLIRSHGVGKDVYSRLQLRGCRIIDGTCGRVRHIHRIAADAAEKGKTLVVFGSPTHPEVQGISGWCPQTVVVEQIGELENVLKTSAEANPNGVCLVFQSTETQEHLKNRKKF